MKKKRCVKAKVFHNKKIKIIVFTILFLMFSTVLFLKFISNKMKDIFIHIAEEETKRLASIVVSNSVTKNVLKYLDTNTIFIITRGENNRIQTVDLDTEIVNKILLESAKIVSKNLTYLQKGMLEKIDMDESDFINVEEKEIRKGIFYKIPIGVATNNIFLSNLGPKIPVRIFLIGDLSTNLNNKITNYGLNNALFEVYINFEVVLTIILPFKSSSFKAHYVVPIASKLINGDLPNYYFNGYNQNSSILTVSVE
ncbi:MAG: sporulation protein YunB [Bacilli bacterium]|nr:sporulation protein YunB [Bacilli bacterium]